MKFLKLQNIKGGNHFEEGLGIDYYLETRHFNLFEQVSKKKELENYNKNTFFNKTSYFICSFLAPGVHFWGLYLKIA